MNEIDDLKKQLLNDEHFSIFTKLLKRKVTGGMLSDEYLSDSEQKLIGKSVYANKKYIFDCPNCNNTINSFLTSEAYNCDCGKTIYVDEIETDIRYVLKEEYFKELNNYFNKEQLFGDQSLSFILWEIEPNTSECSSDLIIHLSPFFDENNNQLDCLDNFRANHFLVNWNLFKEMIDSSNQNNIIEKLVNFKDMIARNQIDWNKINEWIFEDLVVDLLIADGGFSQVIPGGKGPDGGKDAFAYYTISHPSGKEEIHKLLIQCKFYRSTNKINNKDVLEFVVNAQGHNCTGVLIVTTGLFTGATVTKIDSGDYKMNSVEYVTFWDEEEIIRRLSLNTELRLKYFLQK